MRRPAGRASIRQFTPLAFFLHPPAPEGVLTDPLRKVVVVLFLCVAALVDPQGLATAQQRSTTGAIEGTVVDASRATIPGATVTLEQSSTVLATKVTNAAGQFRFDRVLPGTYTVRAALAGFK